MLRIFSNCIQVNFAGKVWLNRSTLHWIMLESAQNWSANGSLFFGEWGGGGGGRGQRWVQASPVQCTNKLVIYGICSKSFDSLYMYVNSNFVIVCMPMPPSNYFFACHHRGRSSGGGGGGRGATWEQLQNTPTPSRQGFCLPTPTF